MADENKTLTVIAVRVQLLTSLAALVAAIAVPITWGSALSGRVAQLETRAAALEKRAEGLQAELKGKPEREATCRTLADKAASEYQNYGTVNAAKIEKLMVRYECIKPGADD